MKQGQELAIVQTPIGELRPDPANPRRISDQELESLTRSIREFGLVDPIIARREDKTVIGGHQRLLAARRLGIKTVPVVFLDLSEEQARLLNLGLNRISGTWDQELLARLLADLKEVPDVDLSLSGFSEDELKKYLKGLESQEKREHLESFDLDTALEAARAAPVAHTGDFWLLGDHRCYAATPPTAAKSHGWWGKCGLTWPSPTRPTTSPTATTAALPRPDAGVASRMTTWARASTTSSYWRARTC
jgi:hypothetical protein